MPDTGRRRTLEAALLPLAVALFLLGLLFAVVTGRALIRAEYGDTLVGALVTALLIWGSVLLLRAADRRAHRAHPQSPRADTWWTGTTPRDGRTPTAAPSRGYRFLRICGAIPLLLAGAFLLTGAVLSLTHGEDGRVTGLLAGFGLLIGNGGLRLSGLRNPSGDTGSTARTSGCGSAGGSGGSGSGGDGSGDGSCGGCGGCGCG